MIVAITWPRLGFWDVLLIVAASCQATTLAYVYNARAKAILSAIPIPFTIAALALGQPIGIAHVLGQVLILGYIHGIRVLYGRFRAPIPLAIIACALSYAVVAWRIRPWLPTTEAAFWAAVAGVVTLALVLLSLHGHRDEPGHRSPLPVPLKFAIVVTVVSTLVVSKNWLGGFMCSFPMVTTVAPYEARHSLWTMARQITRFVLCMSAMFGLCRLFQGHFGLPVGLAAGWAGFLTMHAIMMHLPARARGRLAVNTNGKAISDEP